MPNDTTGPRPVERVVRPHLGSPLGRPLRSWHNQCRIVGRTIAQPNDIDGKGQRHDEHQTNDSQSSAERRSARDPIGGRGNSEREQPEDDHQCPIQARSIAGDESLLTCMSGRGLASTRIEICTSFS